MNKSKRYKNNEKVIVYGLGDGKEYKAVIKGIHDVDAGVIFYIIQPIDSIPNPSIESGYECMSIIESCIKAG